MRGGRIEDYLCDRYRPLQMSVLCHTVWSGFSLETSGSGCPAENSLGKVPAVTSELQLLTHYRIHPNFRVYLSKTSPTFLCPPSSESSTADGPFSGAPGWWACVRNPSDSRLLTGRITNKWKVTDRDGYLCFHPVIDSRPIFGQGHEDSLCLI